MEIVRYLQPNNKRHIIIFACIALLITIYFYWGSFNAGLFCDDLSMQRFAMEKVETGSLYAWEGRGFKFRPVRDTIFVWNAALFGYDTWLLRAFSFISHFSVVILTALLAYRLTANKLISYTAGFIFLLMPANAAAMYGNDCFQDPLYISLGLILLLLILPKREFPGNKASQSIAPLRLAAICFLAFFMLLVKETSISFIFLSVLIVCLSKDYFENRRSKIYAFSLILLLSLAVCLYFYLRTQTSANMGEPDSRYSLSIGKNVIINYFNIFFAACIPTASPLVFAALKNLNFSNLIYLSFTGVCAILVAITALMGAVSLWRRGVKKNTIFLVVGLLLLVGPVTLLQKVSDLYPYGITSLFSILLAAGLFTLFKRARGTGQQLLVITVCGILLITSIHAMNIKKKYHIRNGNIVRSVDDAVRTVVMKHGKERKIAVGVAKLDPVSYSTYLFKDLRGIYAPSISASRFGLQQSNLKHTSSEGYKADITLLWNNGKVKTILNDDNNAR